MSTDDDDDVTWDSVPALTFYWFCFELMANFCHLCFKTQQVRQTHRDAAGKAKVYPAHMENMPLCNDVGHVVVLLTPPGAVCDSSKPGQQLMPAIFYEPLSITHWWMHIRRNASISRRESLCFSFQKINHPNAFCCFSAQSNFCMREVGYDSEKGQCRHKQSWLTTLSQEKGSMEHCKQILINVHLPGNFNESHLVRMSECSKYFFIYDMCSGCIIYWHHNISLWFTITFHLCDCPLLVPEVEFNQWLTDYAFCFWGMGRGWSCLLVIRDYVLDKPVKNYQEGQTRETRLSQHISHCWKCVKHFWAHLQHKQHEWHTYWVHDLGQI